MSGDIFLLPAVIARALAGSRHVAVGSDGEARVILAREGDRWVAERVE